MFRPDVFKRNICTFSWEGGDMTLLIQNDQTYRQSYSSFHFRIPSLKHSVYTRARTHKYTFI